MLLKLCVVLQRNFYSGENLAKQAFQYNILSRVIQTLLLHFFIKYLLISVYNEDKSNEQAPFSDRQSTL